MELIASRRVKVKAHQIPGPEEEQVVLDMSQHYSILCSAMDVAG